MNKYQEALITLTDWFHSYTDENGITIQERHITPVYLKAKETIQELVDKETSLTVNYISDGYADGYQVYDIAICPNCEREFELDYEEHYKYCPSCGQKLDWSD